jgi:hypothetical protein
MLPPPILAGTVADSIRIEKLTLLVVTYSTTGEKKYEEG